MTDEEVDAAIERLNDKLDEARCGKGSLYDVPDLVEQRELFYIRKHRQ